MSAQFLQKTNWTALLLRLGLAFVFVFASVSSFLHPQDWIGYLPSFLLKLLPGETLLKFFSVYEIALALWLLSGKYLRYSGLLATATLLGISFSNLGLFIISFRDFGLAFAAAALAFSRGTTFSVSGLDSAEKERPKANQQ